MSDVKKRLIKKISTSELFVVLGTRNYIDAIKENDESITTQVDTARELKKPFFVVIDRNLSKEDRQYIDEYFSKDNIINRMEVDIHNRAFAAYVTKEIKTLMRELITMEDGDGITMVTPYDDDKQGDDKQCDDNGDTQWSINNINSTIAEKNGCRQNSIFLTKRSKN